MLKRVSREYAAVNSMFVSFDSYTDKLRDQEDDHNFLFNDIDSVTFEKWINLARKNGGHNNFLSAITLNLEIFAPMYWWKQAERYHFFHITGSESTMHTIMRSKLTQRDFAVEIYDSTLKNLNEDIELKDFKSVIANLPSSYIQRKFVTVNYLQLLTIYNQRKNHRLDEWKEFCECILKLPYMMEILKNDERN